MNHHNAENKQAKKSFEGFSCGLFRSPKSDDRDESLDLNFEAFDAWLDQELESLESRFAHNMTVNSQRNDVKATR